MKQECLSPRTKSYLEILLRPAIPDPKAHEFIWMSHILQTVLILNSAQIFPWFPNIFTRDTQKHMSADGLPYFIWRPGFHGNRMRTFSIIKRIPAFVVKSNTLIPTVHSVANLTDQKSWATEVTSFKSRVLEKPDKHQQPRNKDR